MKKEDFPFVIGYQSDIALVDKRFRAHFKRKSVMDLVSEGQYKAAYSRALYQNSTEDMTYIAEHYNRISGSSYQAHQLSRLFGVFTVTELKKTKGI